MPLNRKTAIIVICFLAISPIFAACNLPQRYQVANNDPEAAQPLPGVKATASLTPFQPLEATEPPTPTPAPPLSIWIDPSLPAEVVLPAFRDTIVDTQDQASLRVVPGSVEGALEGSTWIYALAAPFPTLVDDVSYKDLASFWLGDEPSTFPDLPLRLTPQTLAVIDSLLGTHTPDVVEASDAAGFTDAVFSEPYRWAVIPFQELQPQWKVLTLDGQNPLRKEFDASAYPLKSQFSLEGDPEVYGRILEKYGSPTGRITVPGNRDPEKMTVLLMTGVTALVRATGWMMDTRGIEFPARDIGDLLRAADITHISNEVSFSPDCPPADPGSGSLRFCSDPDYFQLLTSIGVDIVELSGNHVNDWGTDAMDYSLELYRQAGIPYYSGGANQEEARQAVILEDHGNRLAFIGCNEAGPSFAWATETEPGSAACELDWIEAEVTRLKTEGILPVVTFQFDESYSPQPMPWQVRDFERMAGAGAAVVSGSQAHSPQTFEFFNGNFIHYGPGNLFFDQMNVPGLTEATRWEFLDRYTIYEGRLLGVELITAMLEDWSRPRLMTPAERYDLLKWIFNESGWRPEG